MSVSSSVGLYREFLRALQGVHNTRVRTKLYQNIRTGFEVNKASSDSMSPAELEQAVLDSLQMLQLLRKVGEMDPSTQSQLLANWRD